MTNMDLGMLRNFIELTRSETEKFITLNSDNETNAFVASRTLFSSISTNVANVANET